LTIASSKRGHPGYLHWVWILDDTLHFSEAAGSIPHGIDIAGNRKSGQKTTTYLFWRAPPSRT
jgi:hypothetical protein